MEDFASLVGRNEQTDGTYFKYSGCYEDIAKCIRKYIPAWMVDMERFFELVVFNYIYANGDDHLKNFSVIRQGGDYRLIFSLKKIFNSRPFKPCLKIFLVFWGSRIDYEQNTFH